MMDIDDEIRRGLTSATAEVDGIDASELARRLTERRAGTTPHHAKRHRTGRHRRLGVTALVMVTAFIGGAVWWNGDDAHDVQVQDDRSTTTAVPTAWASWTPGWHPLGTGPVPAMNGASIAQFDGRLIVAGYAFTDGLRSSSAYAFDTTTREWAQLPVPPLATISIATAGDTLVAVGEPSANAPIDDTVPMAARDFAWATWHTGDAQWQVQGTFQVAAPLRSVGALGPSPLGGGSYLLWTGERVIDVTHGAVLGLDGEQSQLEFPGDVIGYTHLLSAQPVWTGHELVLTSWSSEPGLAWNADGSLFEDTSAMPAELTDEEGVARDTSAVVLDGEVVLVTLDDDTTRHNVVALDPRSRVWRILPDLPSAGSACRQQPVVVADEIVVNNCDVDASQVGNDTLRPLRLHNGAWESIGESPSAEPCCMRTILGTDEALVIWSTDTDPQNNPEAPYVRGTVWIPPRNHAASELTVPPTALPTTTAVTTETTGPLDTTCHLELLPDLGAVLPDGITFGPEPGVGGDPMSSKGCARFWGNPAEPGRHITQFPGDLPFTPRDERSSTGPVSYGIVEDGFGLVYNGDVRWSAVAYGVAESEFVAMVDLLNAAATTG